MFTVALVYGGEGYSAFMVVLPVLYYNGLERSFDSLQTALVRVIQGKDQARRHIAKMKIKGFNIALIRLSAVCYLTCCVFMFVYKFNRQIFGRVVTFP